MTDDEGRGERSRESRHERPDVGTELSHVPEGHALPSEIGEVMANLARSFEEKHADVDETLSAITFTAVGAIPGAEAADVTLAVSKRELQSRASTSELPVHAAQLQIDVGEGPCLQSLWEEETVRSDDLEHETRWPTFAARAHELGVGSILAFQLFVEGDNMGALDLYSTEPHAFTEDSETIGLLFAAHAAVALSGSRREQHLRTALQSRDLIGQAKGILMERHRLTDDQAFSVLTRASTNTNRKLVDIADDLVSTGALPEGARPWAR